MTSAALTWYFWLLNTGPYHVNVAESIRLYPPVPANTKEATKDDVLHDGTVIKKGMRVTYHPYSMGRLEELWGLDWSEFKPERWLKRDANSKKLSFVMKNSYTYPVFQAGPRICLGKEMAFVKMKRVVAGVVRRFRVISVAKEADVEPIFVSYLSSKMKSGFPIEERVEH